MKVERLGALLAERGKSRDVLASLASDLGHDLGRAVGRAPPAAAIQDALARHPTAEDRFLAGYEAALLALTSGLLAGVQARGNDAELRRLGRPEWIALLEKVELRPMRLGQLASALGRDRSAVFRTVGSMEAEELLESDGRDAGARWVQTTARGLHLLQLHRDDLVA